MDIREVPAAQLRWEVGWQDLLVMEPRMSSSTAANGMPDRLVVHRKGRPGVNEQAPLTYELRIFPNTPQVSSHLLLSLLSCSAPTKRRQRAQASPES